MTWLAMRSSGGCRVARNLPARLERGSLVVELRMPQLTRPRPLIATGPRGNALTRDLDLGLFALPGGRLSLLELRDGEPSSIEFDCASDARADRLRLTYAWDTRKGLHRIAVEPGDGGAVQLASGSAPDALCARMLAALAAGDERYIAPDIDWIALSAGVEPVGPQPSLAPDTPVAVPEGYRRICDLRPGDTVLDRDGIAHRVRCLVARRVPALGSFRPRILSAPFFGLRRDIVVSEEQRMVLSGTDVEYLFGCETASVRVRDLPAPLVRVAPSAGPLATWCQLLLDAPATLDLAGAAGESLFIGRLRRKPEAATASILGAIPRSDLPEHPRPAHPVLTGFDARILAAQRAA